MNIKTKVALGIILTLVIGIFIGALLNRALIQRRIARAFSLSNPKTFSLWYEHRLGLNPEQSRQIKTILDEHAKTVWEIRQDFMQEMESASQTLHSELAPLLTPEQKRQLERGPFSRRRGPGRDFRPGPPAGPPDSRDPRLIPELQELRDALSLTEEQVDKLRARLRKPGIPPLTTGRRLPDLDAIFAFWQEREGLKDRVLQEILDEEQMQIYARLKEERRQKLIQILEELLQDK
jgi:hypothetical protein